MVAVAAAPRTLAHAKAALLTMAVVAAGTAIFDVVAHPHGGTEHLGSTADYVFTALLLPFVLAALAVLAALHAAQAGRDGRLGRAGFIVAAVGLVAFVPVGVLTLVTADATSGGPVYPLAMLASLVGLVMMAIAWVRAKSLPRWILPAVTFGWIFGGPVAEGGTPGFRGAALILAAVCAAVAVTLPASAETTV
ncbi:hypothetical protein HC031_31365 [Planosporangium thailandense]|uniref:DUF998 domain-containing protein n=1 Tax=Planosporangium thailandense TaxID=765197 RepID=A0ABX0Y9U4_9ACTN|nr:hypothetical protein [Planosporangium thailandense]NJC74180.1 hypothetical protein [Planosporangium thailandense]